MDVALARLIPLRSPLSGETVVNGIQQAIDFIREEVHPRLEIEGHWLKADLALSSALTWADRRLVDLATRAIEEALACEGWLRGGAAADASHDEWFIPRARGAHDVYTSLQRRW
jgi:hypothetical protein